MPRLAPPPETKELRLAISGNDIALWDRPGAELPIVLIHGNTTSKEVFRALFESSGLAGHRLIALDLPGCGDSRDAGAPDETYTLPGLGGAVTQVAKALGLARYVLVGWSLGGHIAIEAILHGASPDGIVLTGTPPCGPDAAEIAATFLPAPGSEVMSLEHPTPEQFAAFLKTVYAPLAPSAAMAEAAARADGRLRKRFFEFVFTHPELEPQRTTVARWKRPIALVQGRDEPFFDPAKVEQLAFGNLWRGATQWIDGAGHAPFVSHPDDYARMLKEFADDLA